MAAVSINQFTYKLLSYHHQNNHYNGNIALSGIGLYLLLNAINIGLEGSSLQQLSDFLYIHKNLEYLKLTHNRDFYQITRRLLKSISSYNSILFTSIDIYSNFFNFSRDCIDLKTIAVIFANKRESREYMNRAVSYLTNHMITNMYSKALHKDAAMAFASTFVFYCDWMETFKHIVNDTFIDEHGREISVAMMSHTETFHHYEDISKETDYLFVPLKTLGSYGVIVLPKNKIPIRNIIEPNMFENLILAYNKSSVELINLKLPMFTIKTTLNHKKALRYYNVTDLFKKGRANISRMTPHAGFIQAIDQSVHMIIDEHGDFSTSHRELMKYMILKHRFISNFHVKRPFMFHVFVPDKMITLFSAIISTPHSNLLL